jgi:hypothetical protein
MSFIEQLLPATTVVSAESAANTVNGTLISIAPGAGMRVYIVFLTVERLNPTATAVGAAISELSTTLTGPAGGPLTFSTGNTIAAGVNIRDVDIQPGNPLQCGVATTVILAVPAGGAGVRYRANMGYFIAP